MIPVCSVCSNVYISTFDYANHRKTKFFSEFMISFIVSWNGHNSTCTVCC